MKYSKRIEELNSLVRQLSDEKLTLTVSCDYIDEYGDEASHVILDEEVTFAQAFYIKLAAIFGNYSIGHSDSYKWSYLDIYFFQSCIKHLFPVNSGYFLTLCRNLNLLNRQSLVS